ncbi:hypothetical protein [Paraeggerthella sp.]|uniref:hypothetical protein n=1 Tax=Paraeggerthella sp. TaxID=2897350 RepID=UPI0035284836
MAGIWVYAEPKDGSFPRVTFEMLAAARSMAAEGDGSVTAVVLGSGLADVSLDCLAHAGADAIAVLDDAALATYTTDAYASALQALAEQQRPDAVLFAEGGDGT